MEVNRRPVFKKRHTPQFNKGSNKRGKWNGSRSEQASGSSESSDTVYRILCLSKKIGSVIGKGGVIVKALREETESKITVAETIPGSDERVIIIHSPSSKLPRKNNTDNNDERDTRRENAGTELHCAAQDALLRVHDKIVEEDIIGGTENGNDSESVVTARLLVSNNTVGCLLGKKGDVIQRLRSETGANIRVLPAEQRPACAMSTDELVQISGNPAVARRALYEVSTLLHQNPRKDKPPPRFPVPRGGQGFHPHGPPMPTMPPPPANPMWSERAPSSRGAPPMPWMGGYGGEPSGYGPSGFDAFPPPPHGGEAPSEFSMKILCSAAKIGGVIGKGGSNVKQLQQDTGASIHVDEISTESDERVIRVSSIEVLSNPRSRTIDAILHLQDKTSEYSEKGNITTRLLIPSSKVGCILGQGGLIINEMRKRTKADIRVFPKEDKPKCAGNDEELVQVSGNYGIVKDAVGEIASRFRARCLRDTKPGGEPVAIGPGFNPGGFLHGGRPPPPAGYDDRSRGYEPLKGGGRKYEPQNYPAYEPRSHPSEYKPQSHPSEYESRSHPSEYEHRRYPAEFEQLSYPSEYEPRNCPPPPPSASGYPNSNSAMEGKMPGHTFGSPTGTGIDHTGEIGGTRMKNQDPYPGGPPQHVNSAENVYHQGQSGQNSNPQQSSSYHNYNNPQQGGAYPDYNSTQTQYNGTPNNPHQPSHDYYHNHQNNISNYNVSAPTSHQY